MPCSFTMSARRIGTIISTPRMPPTEASVTICTMLKYSAAPPLAMKRNAGIVKTTPAAIDSPADPMVWTMLFSRIVELPSRLKTAIARTAIGIDADTVSPARKARYTVTAPKMIPKIDPRTTAFTVNSATSVREAGMNGVNALSAPPGVPLAGGR